MKKLFSLFLISLTCACAATAMACKKTEKPDDRETFTVTFDDGEGFSYIAADTAEATDSEATENAESAEETEAEPLTSVEVKDGDTVSFRLDIGAFYGGTPTVLAGDVAVSSVDDVYSFTVSADTTVSVEGIQKDVSNMIGTGAYDNPFLVTRPIDLIYIADQVNAGNETYTSATYVLGNDIDCKGEEIKVIGDLNNDRAFFSGCFVSNVDESTNIRQRYTISDFVINSDTASYVGLFGCVQATPAVTNSGLFFGIRLEDFEINAGTEGMNAGQPVIYAGSLVGYGIGVVTEACDAVGGALNLYADDSYFAFAGGLIGCQQGLYEQSYGLPYPSEISYATVDVDVTGVKGATLYAGGVTGYTFTNSLIAPSYLHNVISTGTVSGAMNAGGIVGGLGQYSSISTSYATGDVIAGSDNKINPNNNILTDDTYCHAYAGGLVGYAENDTIVNDSFAVGDTYAQAAMGKNYVHTGKFVGGGAEAGSAGVNAQKYLDSFGKDSKAVNLSSVDINDETFADFKTTLGWREADWTFTAGEYPAINYEPTTETIETTFDIYYVTNDTGVTIKVNNATSTEYGVTDGYQPMMDAFNDGYLPIYMAADTPNGASTNYRSYGYFFDKACTIPVPYAYVSSRDNTLYVGFADYAGITGDYYLGDENETITLTLTDNGYAKYKDGSANISVRYQYDGKTILIEGATFAKFYQGEVDTELSVNEDSLFDLNRYNAYYFEAQVQSDGSLRLYDGTYFLDKKDGETDKALLATKTAPSITVPNADDFNGSWYDPNLDALITFRSFDNTLGNNVGRAEILYSDGMEYTLDYQPAKTAGYYVLYYVYDEKIGGVTSTYKTAFGYFTYNEDNRTIGAIVTDHTETTTGYNSFSFLMVDEYKGDWVSQNQTVFGFISFNGGGYYNAYTVNGVYQGLLQIGDDYVPYTLDSFTNEGRFTYNGMMYNLVLDASTNVLTISPTDGGTSIQLSATDEFAEIGTYVTFNKKTFAMEEYTFNGKGNLPQGGVLTIPGGMTLTYKTANGVCEVFDGIGSKIGTIEKGEKCYLLNYTNGESVELYPTNELMGHWAMSGEFASLEIGPSDFTGNIYASFKGVTVTLEQINPGAWTFSARIENMPVTYYLFLLYADRETEDGKTEQYLSGFAITQYSSLAYNQYAICSKVDEMFGTWAMTETFEGDEITVKTITFDGVSFDPTGRYAAGTVNLSYAGVPTAYSYIKTSQNGLIHMWSQEPLNGYTRYYTVEYCDVTEAGAYVHEDGEKAFKLKEVDALFDRFAKDSNDVKYSFDGGNVNEKEGNVTASNGKKYTYVMNSYDSDTAIWTLTFTEKSGGKKYTAVMSAEDIENMTITLTAIS